MKTENIIRAMRSLSNENFVAFEKIIKTMIKEEKEGGRIRVAKNLEEISKEILNNTSSKAHISNNKDKAGTVRKYDSILSQLPRNPRSNQLLGTLIAYEELRHHMILDPHVEDRFSNIEKEFAARYRLAQYNLKPKRKILLYGPPGCGKTMGAERIARNIGLPLLKINFDTIISSYLGETASNLRSIFDLSKKLQCVILFDECDIIAKSRLQKQDVGEMSRIVNILLVLLDEYHSDGMIIATTNLEDSLDKAIYRRFDDIIKISLPGPDQISNLIQDTISILPNSNKLNLKKLTQKLKGLSAASIVSIGQNAVKSAVLNGFDSINDQIFEQSIGEYYKVV